MFFEAVNVGDLQDKVVDEWTYAELLDPVVYKNRMLGHWSTFVVKSHFEELATAGISHVRCVIEYRVVIFNKSSYFRVKLKRIKFGLQTEPDLDQT